MQEKKVSSGLHRLQKEMTSVMQQKLLISADALHLKNKVQAFT